MGRRSYRRRARCPPGAPPRGWLTSHLVATSTKGPGGGSRKGKSAGGRTTGQGGRPKTAEESGRYTAPIPKSVRQSPRWYGALILILLIGGVAVITLNYLASLPGLARGPGRRPRDDLRRLPAGPPISLTSTGLP